MIQVTKKIYKNSSNGQLLVTAPKCFNEGEEVILILSEKAYKEVYKKYYIIEVELDGQTFIQTTLENFFTEIEDILEYNYKATGFYETYEDLLALDLKLNMNIDVVTMDKIQFTVTLSKRLKSNAPNDEMIKSIKKLMDKDLETEFKKYLKYNINFSFRRV